MFCFIFGDTLKFVATILLLSAFVLQTFYKSFIVADYYTNTTAYSKHCENKARPKLHCNGKCQMMKKLKQEENKDKQNPDRKTDNKEEILSTKSFFPELDNRFVDLIIPYPPFVESPVTVPTGSHFHPPGLAV